MLIEQVAFQNGDIVALEDTLAYLAHIFIFIQFKIEKFFEEYSATCAPFLKIYSTPRVTKE